MAYLYKNVCYAELPDVYATVASYCDPIAFDGSAQFCTSEPNGFTITRVNGGVTTTSTLITPNVEICNPQLTDNYEFAWLLVGIMVAGFLIKSMKAVIK